MKKISAVVEKPTAVFLSDTACGYIYEEFMAYNAAKESPISEKNVENSLWMQLKRKLPVTSTWTTICNSLYLSKFTYPFILKENTVLQQSI